MAKCLVGFEGDDWANVLRVRSPSGRVVELKCNGRWREMSPELNDFVAELMLADARKLRWSATPVHSIEVPVSLMKEILKLSEAK